MDESEAMQDQPATDLLYCRFTAWSVGGDGSTAVPPG